MNASYQIPYGALSIEQFRYPGVHGLLKLSLARGSRIKVWYPHIVNPNGEHELDFAPDGDYRSWLLQARDTKLSKEGQTHYIYAVLATDGTALITFSPNNPYEEKATNGEWTVEGESIKDKDGKELWKTGEVASWAAQKDEDGSWWVHIGKLIYDKTSQEYMPVLDLGELGTPKGENDKVDGANAFTYNIDAKTIILNGDWKFSVMRAIGVVAETLKLGAVTVKHILTEGGNDDGANSSDENLVTSGWLWQKFVPKFFDKFLRKDKDDETTHTLSMGGMHVKGKSGTTGEQVIAKYGHDVVDDMVSGVGKGALFTDHGRLQIDRLEVRRSMSVMELIINQLHAMDGEYWFGDASVIETVIPDGVTSDGYKRFRLTFRTDGDKYAINKWRVDDILFTIISNLGEKGEGEKTYSDCWMVVTAISGTSHDGSDQGASEKSVTVVMLEKDNGSIKAQEPESGFVVVRRGNRNTSVYGPDGSAQENRQSAWRINAKDGQMVYYDDLNSKGQSIANIKLLLGKFNDQGPMAFHGGEIGLYAQTILAETVKQVDWAGHVVYDYVDHGAWNEQDAAAGKYTYWETTEGGWTTRHQSRVYHNEIQWEVAPTATLGEDGYTHIAKTEPTRESNDWVLLSGGGEGMQGEPGEPGDVTHENLVDGTKVPFYVDLNSLNANDLGWRYTRAYSVAYRGDQIMERLITSADPGSITSFDLEIIGVEKITEGDVRMEIYVRCGNHINYLFNSVLPVVGGKVEMRVENVISYIGANEPIADDTQRNYEVGFRFDNFANGYVTISNLKVENNDRQKSTPWCLSEFDKKGQDGKGSIIIDVDNQSGLIGVDSEGKVIDTQVVKTHAYLLDGNEKIDLGSSSTASLTDDGGASVTGISVSSQRTNSNKELEVTVTASANSVLQKSSYVLNITLFDLNGNSYDIKMPIGILKSGTKGESPVIYQLKTHASAIKRGTDGTFTPAGLTVGVTRTLGTQQTDVNYDTSKKSWPDELDVRYNLCSGGDPSANIPAANGGTPYTGTAITPVASNTAIVVALYKGSTRMDYEIVPITSDGTNGKDVCRLTLDHANIFVPCANDGTVKASTPVSVVAHLYEGDTERWPDGTVPELVYTFDALPSLSTTNKGSITPTRNGRNVVWQIPNGAIIPRSQTLNISVKFKGATYTAALQVAAQTEGARGEDGTTTIITEEVVEPSYAVLTSHNQVGIVWINGIKHYRGGTVIKVKVSRVAGEDSAELGSSQWINYGYVTYQVDEGEEYPLTANEFNMLDHGAQQKVTFRFKNKQGVNVGGSSTVWINAMYEQPNPNLMDGARLREGDQAWWYTEETNNNLSMADGMEPDTGALHVETDGIFLPLGKIDSTDVLAENYRINSGGAIDKTTAKQSIIEGDNLYFYVTKNGGRLGDIKSIYTERGFTLNDIEVRYAVTQSDIPPKSASDYTLSNIGAIRQKGYLHAYISTWVKNGGLLPEDFGQVNYVYYPNDSEKERSKVVVKLNGSDTNYVYLSSGEKLTVEITANGKTYKRVLFQATQNTALTVSIEKLIASSKPSMSNGDWTDYERYLPGTGRLYIRALVSYAGSSNVFKQMVHDGTRSNNTRLQYFFEKAEEGKTYTFSFFAKSRNKYNSVDMSAMVVALVRHNNGTWTGSQFITIRDIDDNWRQYSLTINGNVTGQSLKAVMYFDEGKVVEITKPKLEEGGQVTEWEINMGDNQGYPGCQSRPFQDVLNAGQEYRNDKYSIKPKSDGFFADYLLILCPEAAKGQSVSGYPSGYLFYECQHTYTQQETIDFSTFESTQAIKNKMDSILYDSVSTHKAWKEGGANFASAFFTNLIAQSANIRMLSGSCFVVSDTQKRIVAGMGDMVESDDNGNITTRYNIWAGGSDASSAPFAVYKNGVVKSNLLFTGSKIFDFSQHPYYTDRSQDPNKDQFIVLDPIANGTSMFSFGRYQLPKASTCIGLQYRFIDLGFAYRGTDSVGQRYFVKAWSGANNEKDYIMDGKFYTEIDFSYTTDVTKKTLLYFSLISVGWGWVVDSMVEREAFSKYGGDIIIPPENLGAGLIGSFNPGISSRE